MSTTLPSANRAKLTLPSDTEILIERMFNAPARLVFEAMTSPEHMRRWYGCDTMELVSCQIDLRVGGGFNWSVRMPEGPELFWKGEYRVVNPPHEMVSTEQFLLGDTWTDPLVAHTRLEERDGKTYFTNRLVYTSKEHRDGHLNAGMEGGMQESLTRLDTLAQELAAI